MTLTYDAAARWLGQRVWLGLVASYLFGYVPTTGSFLGIHFPAFDLFPIQGYCSLRGAAPDLINRPDFTEAAREPDPELMLRGYERAALTLNFIRRAVDSCSGDVSLRLQVCCSSRWRRTRRLSTARFYGMMTSTFPPMRP